MPNDASLPDRPRRILRVIHTLRREAGGPSESVLRSTSALLDLGHHVEVVTQDPPGTSGPSEGRFPFHPLGRRDDATLGNWLRAHHADFDAVVVHGLWQNAAPVHRALRGTGTPHLVFPHGMLDPWFRRAYPLKHLKKQLYWWRHEAAALEAAAAVCFTCEAERDLARRTFLPYRVHERVVAYGTARPPLPDPAADAALLARFPLLAQGPFLLFLGRIHDKKGVRELITAYAAFRREHPSAPRLVIAGPCATPAEAASLRRLARTVGLGSGEDPMMDTPVLWLPMLEDEQKWTALRACEAFVLLSHQENFGLAVAEALACGRPVLISNKVNIWREITTDGAGIAGSDTIAGGLALLRQWAALSSTERAAMGRAASACFEARFEITRAARDLAAAVGEAVRSRRSF
jgi:glycosyltransferase involved in cell wall biosynthesis